MGLCLYIPFLLAFRLYTCWRTIIIVYSLHLSSLTCCVLTFSLKDLSKTNKFPWIFQPGNWFRTRLVWNCFSEGDCLTRFNLTNNLLWWQCSLTFGNYIGPKKNYRKIIVIGQIIGFGQIDSFMCIESVIGLIYMYFSVDLQKKYRKNL